MRTSLFLSSLFAVTLVTGAAMAEKASSTPVRMPRAVEKIRNHGDVVDKFRGSSARAGVRPQDAGQATSGRVDAPRNPRDKGESRILCGENDVKCGRGAKASHGDNIAVGADAAADKGDRNVRKPAFLDKVLGSDRMNCNEAEECSMSLRAAKRAWSNGQDKSQGDGAQTAAPASQVEKVRIRRAEATDRMACNEAGECMMSSKAAKKIWAYESAKAGTFKGPDAAAKTPAQVAIENAKKK